jgi:HAD superfamily hydrolase (TIGR01549 family)
VIKAVIFDIDGTLVDSVHLHAKAWQEAFRKFGHDVPFDTVRKQIGKGGDQLLPVFLTKEEIAQYGEALEKYRGELFKKKYFSHVRAFPCVRELFQRLGQDGKQIALASSAKGDELETYKRIAQITDLVDEETSSDDAEHSKPHPDIFEAAMKRLKGVDTDETIVVGDSPYDEQAAGKLGLRGVAVRSGGFPDQELRAAGFSEIYDDVADLLKHYNDSLIGRKAAA